MFFKKGKIMLFKMNSLSFGNNNNIFECKINKDFENIDNNKNIDKTKQEKSCSQYEKKSNNHVSVKQKPNGTTITREYFPNGVLKTYTIEYSSGDAYIEEYTEDGEMSCATTRFPSGDEIVRSYQNKK